MPVQRVLFARIAPLLLAVVAVACGSNPKPGGSADAGTADAGATDGGTSVTCTDKAKNGNEADIDCGGGTCVKCGADKSCTDANDCESGLCTGNKCTLATCSDGVKNGTETDQDCGGACAPAKLCADDKACDGNGDCASGKCDLGTHKCAAPSCTDGVKNGSEADKDCGSACSTKCSDTLGCASGDDCISGVCDVQNHTCSPAACNDGVKNGSESDKDCGGTCPTKCADLQHCGGGDDCTSKVCDAGGLCAKPSCEDGVKNGSESDQDCGAMCANKCAAEAICFGNDDCASGVCDSFVCVEASCKDTVKNGDESDKDCGGTCGGCDTNQVCNGPGDCKSGVCSGNVCAAPKCDDGVKNGDETDQDCGGSTCTACGTNQGCTVAADCASLVCTTTGVSDTCVQASCNDQVKNGGESDQDCGTVCATKCADTKACSVNDDCASGVCTGNVCQSPACDDHVLNGDESDVDCGGTCPNKCTTNQLCGKNDDCDQLVCTQNTCRAATCGDAVKNGDETDTDCGGGGAIPCQSCADHKTCTVATDCASLVCDLLALTCTPAACDDLVKNGGESDQDCGSVCTTKCADTRHCDVSADCASGYCSNNVCTPVACDDLAQNGTESDVDCGGTCTLKCADTKHCNGNDDCASGVCTGNACQQAACNDVVKNGTETDVDCGGICPNKCANTLGCSVAADCSSGVCTNHACVAPACNDGVQNGTETGTDCGGTCSACVDISPYALRCTFSTASGGSGNCTVSSSAYSALGADHFTVLGGQNAYVALTASGASYNSGTGTFAFSAAVQNLLSQTIGTIDSKTKTGVRLVLAETSVSSGSGSITAANPTDTDAVTGKPYFFIDETLTQNQTSATVPVQLNVPNTVGTFTASFLITTKIAVKLIINEVLTNPGGTITDANGEWFEVYNAGAFPVNMVGFRIADSAASGDRPTNLVSSATDLIVQPGGYFVFGNTTNTTNNGGVPVDYAYGAGMALANSLDVVRLISPDGYVNDTSNCTYDTTNCSQTNFVELQRCRYANAAVSAQNGISRELKNPALDNSNMDDSTNWADALVTAVYGPGGRGTPKAQNSTYTP